MLRLDVEFLAEAERDLTEIFHVVLKVSQNESTAEGFVRRIIARCRRIGDAPWGGRPRDDLSPGLRTVPFERSAVIAYRIVDRAVTITNIFYGGRDFERLFDPADPQD